MECANHSDRAATAVCQRCDKTLCQECVEDRGGRTFCAACADFVDRRSAGRPAAPPSGPADVYQGPPTDNVYQGPPPGEVYQGAPPAGASQGAPPTDVYQGPPPAGDVYQGPPPAGDVYQGPPPAGDVYQGPPPAGDVYQGLPPGSSAVGGGASGATAASSGGFSIRGLLAAVIGSAAGAMLYYWLYVHMDLKMKFFILIIAFVVGFAARLGGGRGGTDIGLVAAALFAIAVLVGDFSVAKTFQNDYVTEQTEQRRAFSEIPLDGRYTPDEARRLVGYSSDEWNEFSEEERRWEVESLEADHEEARAQGWSLREMYGLDEAPTKALTFGDYLGNILLYLGIWGLGFLVFGCWQAYKIGAAEG